MHIMNTKNEQAAYDDLFRSFRRTLKQTSKDGSGKDKEPPEPDRFMTDCSTEVVDFDRFKSSITKHGWGGSPESCDALYRYDADTWFLIEFKNGILENTRYNVFHPDASEFYAVIRKLFESLFLLTRQLGQTVDFTRKKITFILVYNEEISKNLNNEWFHRLSQEILQLGHSEDVLRMRNLSDVLPKSFNTEYFDKLYVRKAYICSKEQFKEFVERYAE